VVDQTIFKIDLDDLYLEPKPFSDGAYSKVYKALYRSSVVCVKVIDKKLESDDPDFFEYVEREIRILSEIFHPNVLEFVGAAEDDHDFFIITEYVPGGNIRQYLKTKKFMSWDLKIHIAIGVAQGIGYLHSQNILHRDVKSENFLVGDKWQIKVCDYGFARRIESLGRKRSLSICGTEEYMAPEVLVGLEYNEKVDVFSYGIFLAELLTQCYLPTDLKRTPANQFGLNVVKFKDLLPDDCPTQLSDLVIECCNQISNNRPNFENVIHRLHDIQYLLPFFSIMNEPVYEFEELLEEVKEHMISRRKSKRSSRTVVMQEIKIEDIEEEDLLFADNFEIEMSESISETSEYVSGVSGELDDDFDEMDMEEFKVENFTLIEIPDEPDKAHFSFEEHKDMDKDHFVTINEKYSFFYN